MKTPLGTEVDLGPGHIVLDEVPALRERGTTAPLFSAHVYCGHGHPSQLLLSSCSFKYKKNELEQRCFSKHKPHAGRRNWPRPSNSFERRTKHIFLVNLVQIRSAVPEIFHTQTKSHRERQKQKLIRSWLRAVNTLWLTLMLRKATADPRGLHCWA